MDLDLLDLSTDELLEVIEAKAASGSARAERMLALLLAEEARTGGIGVIARLACTPLFERDRHADERNDSLTRPLL